MIPRLSLILALLLSSPCFAEDPAPNLQVAYRSISEYRSLGEELKPITLPRLKVGLKITGDWPKTTNFRARIKVISATEDTGKSLVEEPLPAWRLTFFDHQEFFRPETIDSQIKDSGIDILNMRPVYVPLTISERSAKSIANLEGVLEAYLPHKDPGSEIVVMSIPKPLRGNFKVTDPRLKEIGLEIEFIDSKTDLQRPHPLATEFDNLSHSASRKYGQCGDYLIKIDDPNFVFVTMHFVNEKSEPIFLKGSSYFSATQDCRALMPSGLKILVATEKNLLKVPFKFTDIKLP